MKLRTLSAAVATALLSSITQVHAAGFQLAEYSSTGLGRAYAGEAAMADNASAQGRNPALLAQLQGRHVSAGAIYVNPNVDVPGNISIASPVLGNKPIALHASAMDVADSAVVPNFYYSAQLDGNWTWGIALNANYGMATEIDAKHSAALFGQKTSIKTVEFNPNLAYRLNDVLSFGFGARIVHSDAEINASMPGWINGIKSTLTNSPSSVHKVIAARLPSAGTSLKHMKGDDIGFGWKVGLNWKVSKDHNIGLAYHSGVDLKLAGEVDGLLYTKGQPVKFEGYLPLELPAFAEIASFHQLTDKLAIHASVNWTQWSSFKELRAFFPHQAKPKNAIGKPISEELLKHENFKNNMRYALGTSYQLTQDLLLRAGIALDKTAVGDEFRTTTIPDSDRLWFSTGAAYTLNKSLTVDFGLTYIKARGDAPITESMPLNGLATVTFTGNAEGDVWLAGAQLNYKF
ncbi:MAG: outer membrane protein transport protein [Parashewanella sp.]